MVEVVGDWLIKRRQFSVDQQMVMSGILLVRASGRNTHALEAEMHGEFGRDGLAVLEVDEVDRSSRCGRRRPARLCLAVGQPNGCCKSQKGRRAYGR